MPIVIERVLSPTDDARQLVAELDAELSGEYSAEQCHGLSLEKLFRPNILFFVAYLEGAAAGCGGIAFEDDFAEVKRMYVRPAVRGRGVAFAIMERLEAEARARPLKRLVLETGDVRHAAMKFYQRVGFVRCAAFGAYTKMTPDAIERSVFFQKWIS